MGQVPTRLTTKRRINIGWRQTIQKAGNNHPLFNAEEWRLATLVHSAIAGVSLAAIVELVNLQNLSNLLVAATILFALALPSSVSSVVRLLYYQARNKSQAVEAMARRSFWSGIRSLLALIAQLAGFGGVLLLFWDLHWITGVTFAATSLVALVTLAAVGAGMRRRSERQDVFRHSCLAIIGSR